MPDATANSNRPHRGGRRPLEQLVLIASLLPLCWLTMLAVHELGHVLGAWVTGARVTHVELHPLRISRTDVVENRDPRLVAWAGPLCGCLLPLLVWGCVWARRWRTEFLVRFWGGFCLVANGAYLGVGSWEGVGDAGVLLDTGCSVWWLWLFGAVTVSCGLRIWHGLGPHFGWGTPRLPVDRQLAWKVLLLLIVVAGVEWLYYR